MCTATDRSVNSVFTGDPNVAVMELAEAQENNLQIFFYWLSVIIFVRIYYVLLLQNKFRRL
jgi:hypothetical protein